MTHTLPHRTHAPVGASHQAGSTTQQQLPTPPASQPHSREATIRPRARDIFAIPSHARTAAPHQDLDDADEPTDTPRQGRPAPTVFRSAPDTQPRPAHISGQSDPNSIPRITLPDAGPSSIPYHPGQNGVGAAPAQGSYFPGPTYPPPHPALPPQLLHSAVAAQRGAPLSHVPTLSNPPPYTPSPPTNPNQRRAARGRNGPETPPAAAAPQAGGRFPRWRGWLEKRALERHFDRLGVGSPDDDGMRRKKSWGTGVNDPDAVSDEDPDLQEDIPQRILPPLHVHQMGSRFLPHLPSQPLCSIYISVPCPGSPTLRIPRRGRQKPPTRSVLLIGTPDGLFGVEHRRTELKDARTSYHEGFTRAQQEAGWNENIRCRQIWSGLGVYQLSVLRPHSPATPPPTTSSIPFLGSRGPSAHSASNGVILALCAPIDHRCLPQPRLSAQSGSVLEQNPLVSSSASISSHGPSSSHGHGSTSFADDSLPSINFGTGAGGGIGRVVPPGGAGVVKMWHEEAVRKVVAYVMNDQDAPPLDLSVSHSETQKSGSSKKFSHKVRNAWASLAEPKSERALAKASRRAESDSYGVIQDRGGHSRLGSSGANRYSSDSYAESWQTTLDDDMGSDQEGAETDEHAQALRLAKAAVSINPPSGSAAFHSSRDSSGISSPPRSILSDDGLGTFGKAKAKDRDSGMSLGQSRGFLYYAVYESPAGYKGAGTWYLALASARTILLYESPPPRRAGTPRSWTFLKELAYVAPKAISFLPAATATAEDGIAQAAKASYTEEGKGHHGGADRSSRHGHGFNFSPSVLLPQHGAGAAAPASWTGADLSLFVSFGRKAIIVRLSDLNVRELGSLPESERGFDAIPKQPSLRPLQSSPNDLAPSTSGAEGIKGHRKRPSTDSTGTSGTRANKNLERWVGLHHVEAKISVIQREETEPRERPSGTAAMPGYTWNAAPRPPIGLTTSSTSVPTMAGHERLPDFTPGESFRPPLMDRAVQSATGHRTLEFADDGSDDSDDEDEDGEGADDEDGYNGVTLQDNVRPSLAHHRGSASESNVLERVAAGRRPRPVLAKPPTDHGKTFELMANVVLLSRGQTTHVLPYPIPADLSRPKVYEVFHWSEIPCTVTAWSRVLGIERATSSGPLSTSHLASSGRGPGKADSAASDRHGGIVRLRLSLTALAFSQYRVEMQRTTFRVDVKMPPGMGFDTELQLCPSLHDGLDETTGARSNGHAGGVRSTASGYPTAVLDPTLRPSLANETLRMRLDLDYLTGFVLPASLPGGSIPRTLFSPLPSRVSTTPAYSQGQARTRTNSPMGSAEGGMTLGGGGSSSGAATPASSPGSSAGMAAHVGAETRSSVPAGLGMDRADYGSHNQPAPPDLSPFEAAGDGGAWAFSWRGGNDYRICYFGAEV